MDYMISACNTVYKVVLSSPDPPVDDVRGALNVACNALKLLSGDPEFGKALHDLRHARNPEEFHAITSNVDHFVQGFCRLEAKALSTAGLSDYAVKVLLEKAVELREQLSKKDPSPDEVLKAVAGFQGEVCWGVDGLATEAQLLKEAAARKKMLRRLGYVSGGVVMVFVDTSAAAASVGLSVAGSAVSVAVGGTLIAYGAGSIS